MAHMIDMSNSQANVAYVGATPWHGLGQKLTPGAGLEIWAQQAGLSHEVLRSPVQWRDESGLTGNMPERHVLYRSDNRKALSVVGKDYQIVQPATILDFFGKLAEVGGFELEVAGSLSDGKRIWGLARVNDGAPVIGHDVVRPYLLLATSYDASMATTAKFTAIRVVCNNTITMAVGRFDGQSYSGKSEDDTENQAVNTMIRIPHCNKFDPEQARQALGIAGNAWEKWLIQTRLLAERTMEPDEAAKFLNSLLLPEQPKPADGRAPKPIEETKAYRRIMSLFDGGLIGAGLAGNDSRWTMLNAVTEFVDHEQGNTPSTRMNAAWFGTGDAIKSRAYRMLQAA